MEEPVGQGILVRRTEADLRARLAAFLAYHDETAGAAAWPSVHTLADDDLEHRTATVGTVHPHVECKIVDCDTHFTEPPDIFTSRAPACSAAPQVQVSMYDADAVPVGQRSGVPGVQDLSLRRPLAQRSGQGRAHDALLAAGRHGDDPAEVVQPHQPHVVGGLHYIHLGLYIYKRDTLLRLASLPTSRIEDAEKLEQLRALDHGIRIRVWETKHASLRVDRPEDVPDVAERLQQFETVKRELKSSGISERRHGEKSARPSLTAARTLSLMKSVLTRRCSSMPTLT